MAFIYPSIDYYVIDLVPVSVNGQIRQYTAAVVNLFSDYLPSWNLPTFIKWSNTFTGPGISAEVDSFGSGTPYSWNTLVAWGIASGIYITIDTGIAADNTLEKFVFTLNSETHLPYKNNPSIVIGYVDSVTIATTEYPNASSFAPDVKVNYETTRDGTSAIWRQVPPSFNPTISSDLFVNFGTPVSGYSIFQYDDGTQDISTNLFTHNDNSVTYTLTNSTSTITHVVSNMGVVVDGQLFNYTGQKSMVLNLVDLIPSASFITYPSSAWNGTTWIDVASDYTISPGASAYGNGHTELFNLSALSAVTVGDVTYRWDVGPHRFTVLNDSTTAYAASSPNPQATTITLPVSLGVFTERVPQYMPQYHYNDSGAYVRYPNFNETITDNSDKLFQHLRMVTLNTTSNVEITSVSPEVVVIPFYNGFTASLSSVADTASLLINPTALHDWSLTNSGYWTINYPNTGSTVSFTISVGNQSVPGQINPNQLTYLNLSVSSNISAIVTPGGGYWPVVITQATDSRPVSSFEFSSRVYLTNRYNATGENVVYQNASLVTPLLSATYWDDGISSVKLDGYESFITQYDTPASYDLAVSSVLTDGADSILIVDTYSDTSVVIPKFQEYDDGIIRIFGTTTDELPISLDHCKMPPNEWCEANNINRSLQRLDDNFRYIKNIGQLYSAPPTELYGWYGNHNQVGEYWHVNIDNLDTDYTSISGALPGKLTNVKDVITDANDNIYVINDTTVSVLSADWRATNRYDSSIYNEPVSIALDSINRLHVLDKSENKVYVLNELTNVSPFTLRKFWGGAGGAGSKDKYNNPTDIYINDTLLWIVDAGNNCVKKYTEGGAWQKTIQNSYFDNSTPVSITDDIDGNIHVLLKNNTIIKMNANGETILDYSYPDTLHATPRRIRSSADEGFLYITLDERIIKVNKDGDYVGEFASGVGGTINYQSLYQDEHRNTFLANGITIVKYVDIIESKSLNINTGSSEWTVNDIKIDRDEFNENWVYNRCFARMWDNFELFRRSLIGKPSISTQEGSNQTTIVPFAIGEYVNLPYHKSQIYIGVNEIVTADVINRCIGQLYECEQTLVDLIS